MCSYVVVCHVSARLTKVLVLSFSLLLSQYGHRTCRESASALKQQLLIQVRHRLVSDSRGSGRVWDTESKATYGKRDSYHPKLLALFERLSRRRKGTASHTIGKESNPSYLTVLSLVGVHLEEREGKSGFEWGGAPRLYLKPVG